MRTILIVFCLCFSAPCVAQTEAAKDPSALPDLRIAKGKQITEAWLTDPVTRYQHYVLGSRYEAGGLRVAMQDGRTLGLTLDAQHVFEDRTPRIADINGDGHEDVVLVLSSLTQGASLAVFDVSGDQISLLAKTPFIGRSFRWLNPAGIADFNGDGRLDVALVAMPHLIKRLEFWTLTNGNLSLIADGTSYSNHRNGSAHTGLSAVADVNKDGVSDLILPSGDRRSLKAVTLVDGSIQTLANIDLSGEADGPWTIEDTDQGTIIEVGLAGGRSDRVTFLAR